VDTIHSDGGKVIIKTSLENNLILRLKSILQFLTQQFYLYVWLIYHLNQDSYNLIIVSSKTSYTSQTKNKLNVNQINENIMYKPNVNVQM
jgi:hypothetical protein